MSDYPTDPDILLAHTSFLRRLARSLVDDPSTVDDVVQDTWLSALRSPPRHSQAIVVWLTKVMRSVVRERRRSDKRRRRREIAVASRECFEDSSLTVERLDVLRGLVDALASLEEPYRSTVMLRFFDEKTPQEIAQEAGVPVATVHTRLRRAQDKIRKRMRNRGHEDLGVLILATQASTLGRSTRLYYGGLSLLFVAAGIVGMLVWFHEGHESDQESTLPSKAPSVASGPMRSDEPSRTSLEPLQEIERSDGAEVVLRVVKESGGPGVAGAKVLLARREAFAVEEEPSSFVEQDRRRYETQSWNIVKSLLPVSETYWTDEDGLVSLPSFGEATIYAEHGVQCTWGSFLSGPEPIELVLSGRLLRIQTVREGRPIRDVPVALYETGKNGEFVRWSGRTVGNEGMALVGPTAIGAMRRGAGWSPRLRARVRLSSAGTASVPIDVHQLPKAPVVLTLGALGRVVVDIQHDDGRPFLGEAYVGLGMAGKPQNYEPAANMMTWVPSLNGQAVFDHVGFSLRLVTYIHVIGGGRASVVHEFDGPEVARSETYLRLQVGSENGQLRGRAVDDRARPHHSAKLRALSPFFSGERTLHTDEDGQFSIPIEVPYHDPWARKNPSVRIGLDGEANLDSAVIGLSEDIFRGKDMDVGDVVLARGPLPMQGRVSDTEGRPLSKVGITAWSYQGETELDYFVSHSRPEGIRGSRRSTCARRFGVFE